MTLVYLIRVSGGRHCVMLKSAVLLLSATYEPLQCVIGCTAVMVILLQ